MVESQHPARKVLPKNVKLRRDIQCEWFLGMVPSSKIVICLLSARIAREGLPSTSSARRGCRNNVHGQIVGWRSWKELQWNIEHIHRPLQHTTMPDSLSLFHSTVRRLWRWVIHTWKWWAPHWMRQTRCKSASRDNQLLSPKSKTRKWLPDEEAELSITLSKQVVLGTGWGRCKERKSRIGRKRKRSTTM